MHDAFSAALIFPHTERKPAYVSPTHPRSRRGSRIRDTVDYYTVWAHQIKTPIAAMRLTLQKEDVPEARRLASELSRIEQYVEMVLVFVRLGSDYSDYVFARQDIDEIIRNSVKKFASEFIDRRIRLEYDSVDIQAVTDEKWFAFVVEQLLSNAPPRPERGRGPSGC